MDNNATAAAFLISCPRSWKITFVLASLTCLVSSGGLAFAESEAARPWEKERRAQAVSDAKSLWYMNVFSCGGDYTGLQNWNLDISAFELLFYTRRAKVGLGFNTFEILYHGNPVTDSALILGFPPSQDYYYGPQEVSFRRRLFTLDFAEFEVHKLLVPSKVFPLDAFVKLSTLTWTWDIIDRCAEFDTGKVVNNVYWTPSVNVGISLTGPAIPIKNESLVLTTFNFGYLYSDPHHTRRQFGTQGVYVTLSAALAVWENTEKMHRRSNTASSTKGINP